MPVSHARAAVSSLLVILANITDPRDPRGVRHPLVAVLGVAVVATLVTDRYRQSAWHPDLQAGACAKEALMAAGEGHAVEPGVRELLLDRQLPRFEARTISTVVVDAGTQETYRAVRVLDPDQVWQTVPFMRLMAAVRELPARIWARVRGAAPTEEGEALSAEQYRQAFLVLDEEPGVELVIGMIGKFMSPIQMEFRRFDPPQFAGFSEPGYGKVAFNFLVLPYGTGRSLLSTETRTATTDPASVRRFRRYWLVIGPFAGFIMRHWLTLAKQHAEPRG